MKNEIIAFIVAFGDFKYIKTLGFKLDSFEISYPKFKNDSTNVNYTYKIEKRTLNISFFDNSEYIQLWIYNEEKEYQKEDLEFLLDKNKYLDVSQWLEKHNYNNFEELLKIDMNSNSLDEQIEAFKELKKNIKKLLSIKELNKILMGNSWENLPDLFLLYK